MIESLKLEPGSQFLRLPVDYRIIDIVHYPGSVQLEFSSTNNRKTTLVEFYIGRSQEPEPNTAFSKLTSVANSESPDIWDIFIRIKS